MRHQRQRRQRRPARARQRAVDDRRARHHPFRDARAGRRPHGRLPALGQPRRERQDDARPPTATSPPADVPVRRRSTAACSVRVIAGASRGVTGAVTRPTHRAARARHRAAGRDARSTPRCPPGHNAFAYVYGGGGRRRRRARRRGSTASAWRSWPTTRGRRRAPARADARRGRRACCWSPAAARRADRAVRSVRDEHHAEIQQAVADFQRGALAA